MGYQSRPRRSRTLAIAERLPELEEKVEQQKSDNRGKCDVPTTERVKMQ
jgi:hypothetical protein